MGFSLSVMLVNFKLFLLPVERKCDTDLRADDGRGGRPALRRHIDAQYATQSSCQPQP